MSVENTTEVTTATEQPKADEKPQSREERLTKFVTEKYEQASAAEESAAATTEPATEAKAAATQTETTVETKSETPAEDSFTPEQISDRKFWDSLNKDGWSKAERLHPVETAKVKAAYRAAGRIAEEARQNAQKPSVQAANDKPTDEISPELKAAITKASSMNEKEAAEGLQQIVKLTLKDALPEFGFNPAEAKATAIAQTAYANVIAEVPEIASLDPNALDAAVASDPTLTSLLEVAADLPDQKRIAITANVMRKAAETVLLKHRGDTEAAAAAKKVQDDKTKETQRKVRSNASNVSSVIVESPTAGAPAKKPTLTEFILNKWGEEAGKQQ